MGCSRIGISVLAFFFCTLKGLQEVGSYFGTVHRNGGGHTRKHSGGTVDSVSMLRIRPWAPRSKWGRPRRRARRGPSVEQAEPARVCLVIIAGGGSSSHRADVSARPDDGAPRPRNRAMSRLESDWRHMADALMDVASAKVMEVIGNWCRATTTYSNEAPLLSFDRQLICPLRWGWRPCSFEDS